MTYPASSRPLRASHAWLSQQADDVIVVPLGVRP